MLQYKLFINLFKMSHMLTPASLLNCMYRCVIMLAGIAVMGFGIVVITRASLGNSPISACPYVVNLAFSDISFGTIMLAWQCLLVAIQVIVLRKDFQVISLLQIPVSVFFGGCIDFSAVFLGELFPQTYMDSLAFLGMGILFLALGVTLTIISRTVMNCGEVVVQAIATKTHIRFGTLKVVFDVSYAVVALCLSYLLMGHLEGVREGTIICAVLTGFIVNLFILVYRKTHAQMRLLRRSFCATRRTDAI